MIKYLKATLRAEKLNEETMFGEKHIGMWIRQFLAKRGQYLGELHLPGNVKDEESQELFFCPNGAVINLSQHSYTSKRDYPFHDEDIDGYPFQGYSGKKGQRARVRLQIFSHDNNTAQEAKTDLESRFTKLKDEGF